jgi:hypothetical protein
MRTRRWCSCGYRALAVVGPWSIPGAPHRPAHQDPGTRPWRQIEAEHRAALDAARNAIDRACGRLLIQAKAWVGYGQRLAWVADHLSFGDRQARKSMQLAQHRDQIGLENADLNLDRAGIDRRPAPRDARGANGMSLSNPDPCGDAAVGGATTVEGRSKRNSATWRSCGAP